MRTISLIIIIEMNPNQYQEARKKKRDSQIEVGSQDDDSGQEEAQIDDESYESSFIQNDDEISEDYSGPFRGQLSDQEGRKKKNKKDKKKDKKKSKEKRKRHREEQFDEGDIDILDNDDNQVYSRLKKKKESRKISMEDEEYEENQEGRQDDEMEEEDEGIFGDDNQAGYYDEEPEDSLSSINEVIDIHKDIFEPDDLKKMTIEDEDRELVQVDIPERQLIQIRNYAKNTHKSSAEARKQIENDDRHAQAQWIYDKLRDFGYLESYNDYNCKERIRGVLEAMHREHLEIMYIFYYRKKVYSDFMNLEILWKIEELDEQWLNFREKRQKLSSKLIGVVQSIQEVPKQLEEMFARCNDERTLKYFEDYENFVEAKLLIGGDEKRIKGKKNNKNLFIGQVHQCISTLLQKSQIFLSPQNLCINLRERQQQKKPKTPQSQPKYELEQMFKANIEEYNKGIYNLLTPEVRFKTIIHYLALELFSYPELRKILKEKYYRKLVISTTPTVKGAQEIDLYNIFFPVKRIKDKPISTLKRQVWILARQAEKVGLINIELKFEWELSSNYDREKAFQSDSRDSIYLQIKKYYFDISSHRHGEMWNLFRKQVISKMLELYFLPAFMKEVKEDLTKEGEKQIISVCCQTLKANLKKGPSLKEGKQKKILAMVLQDQKLGMAFVDQVGQPQFTHEATVVNDEDLKQFVSQPMLSEYIKENKPDMILVAANCRKAQTLRKQLRSPNLFSESTIFCAFGEYEVPSLVAKKKNIEGVTENKAILEAISMARMTKNPMSQIASLWNDKINENGIMSMNLHQYQGFIDQKKLKAALQKILVQVINLVGLDINDIRENEHTQNQLQFICGLGPKKAFVFLQKMKQAESQIINRQQIQKFVTGKVVYKNCSPFFKVDTIYHRNLLNDKVEKDKKKNRSYEDINLLDMTRIPQEWYGITSKRMAQIIKSNSLLDMRSRKGFSNLTDETIALIEIFKHPEKIRGIEWKSKENIYFDDELVKSEIMSRFKNPRDPEKKMENRETFFNLLRQTPQSLKKYMIMPVKVLSARNNYLNVIIPQNGLFGYIRMNNAKDNETQYPKGATIKAIILGFPFDPKSYSKETAEEEQELLKVQMGLEFPHRDRSEGRHDCFVECFPQIVKSIHPLIDLQKDRFDLRKQDMPVIETQQEKVTKNLRTEYRRISHPKFKNISVGPAIQMMKNEAIGQFILRPSSSGPEYITITWNFFKGVISHIKVKCEHKTMSNLNYVYRVEDKDNRTFNSIEDMIDKFIKPMNLYVQDVISNKKFLTATTLDQVDAKIKEDMAKDPSHIYYYFSCCEDYPQYFVLTYMYKDKKPIKELVKVRSTGLFFHDQQFQSIRDLIAWFKEHLKEKEYQKYAKSSALRR